MLDGKCKIDFEKWFEVNPENSEGLKKEQLGKVKVYQLGLFYQLTQSMQYGVYVDFFDKNEIQMAMYCWGIKDYSFTILKEGRYLKTFKGQKFQTRQEARESAIKQANKIYNNI